PWSEAAADWLRQAAGAGLPMFGICYGHQCRLRRPDDARAG
ncbi:glutamine amidotransferase-related protein, partial [Bordetella pertussis]